MSKLTFGLLVLIAVVAGIVLVARVVTPPTAQDGAKRPSGAGQAARETRTPDPGPRGPAVKAGPPSYAANVFIGRNYEGEPRRVHSIYITRQREVIFQALIHFEPQIVALNDVPGASELIKALVRMNRPLPERLCRVDEETEMLKQSLGEPLRFISSYRAYFDQVDGRTVAYELVQTTGGQPQRMLGHITREGVSVTVYRGTEMLDHHDVPFPVRGTFIPITYDFIHQWYQLPENKAAKAKKEQIKFSIFAPQAMALLLLKVRPLEDAVIPVGDANYTCARYEVIVMSTKSGEGLQARQEMYFDKNTGLLVRRQDFDPYLQQADAPVTERETSNSPLSLERVQPLLETAPQLPPQAFPYPLDEELVYRVKARDSDFGHVRVKFARAAAPLPTLPPEGGGKTTVATGYYVATATVDLEGGGAARHETAETYFDKDWYALDYQARGEEGSEHKSNYTLRAAVKGGKIEVAYHQQAAADESPTPAPLSLPAPQRGEGNNGLPALWQDPLRRVPVSDDDARAEESPPPLKRADYTFQRVFPAGVFMADFNRVEQLAALASRFPLPKVPAVNEPPAAASQKAALFLVRQNRTGVLLFEIKPESRPVLTERQKRRLGARLANEPQLYEASAAGALLPCKMLLSGDGRLLELTMKYGAGDVVYTLDDPIMRQRAERARERRQQEGPQLLRAPWW